MSHSTDTMECTNPDCHRQTSMFLCTDCIITLDGLLKVVPALIIMLTGPINRTSVTRNPGGSSGGGGNSTGSKPPINLEALDLRTWLQQLPTSAYTEALTSPTAGRTLVMAGIWVANAETLVYGPPEEVVDHEAIKQRIQNEAPPMPTRTLVPWLREHARITISGKDIRNWVARGKIRAVANEGQPTYHPHDVLQAWKNTRQGVANETQMP